MREDQFDEVKRVTLGYIQRRSRRTGTMYTSIWTSGNKTVSIKVSPETTYDGPTKSVFERVPEIADMCRKMAYKNQIKLQHGLKRPDVIFGGAAGVSTTVLCRAFGLKLAPALRLGVAAGAITFSIAFKNLDK